MDIILGLGAVVIALTVAFFGGSLYGNAKSKAKEAERAKDALKDRDELEDEIHGLDDPDLDRRYDRWVRK